MYEILLERRAEKDLRRLTTENFQRIIAVMKTLAGNPRAKGCGKLAGSDNDWRIRVGDYRILYEIDDDNQAIRVMSRATE